MYKLTINKDALLEAMSLTNLATKKGTGIISSSTLFELDDDGVVLKASDRRVLASIKIPEGPEGLIDKDSSGSAFTIESHRLSKWAENVFGDEIELLVDDNKQTVHATCGDAEAYFRSLDPASFPDFATQYNDAEHVLTCKVSDFAEPLDFVKKFVAGAASVSDKLKVAQLRGTRFFGTNSRILSIYQSAVLDSEIKVGKEEINRVLSFFKAQDPESEVDVLESDNLFFLQTEDGSLFGFTKPFGDLPELQSIPNKLDEPEIWTLNKSQISHSIAALSASASEDDYVLNVSIPATERVSANPTMTLSMRDAQDKHDAKMDVGFVVDRNETDEDLSFSINYEYLTDALSLYSGSEVTAAFDAESKYIKFYEETENGDLKICLITLRLN